MTDLVLFAGPVFLKPAFMQIAWERPTQIVPIAYAGSANGTALGKSLRGPDGRILPALLKKYARGIEFERLALCAYSAGHGLLNEIGQNDADRAAVSAVVLDDAAFIGDNRPVPPGLVNWAVDGAEGKRLFVATSSAGDGETYRSGSESVSMIWYAAAKATGAVSRDANPESPVDVGVWRELGKSAFWGDIRSLTHGEHHDYSPVVWQAYLAPYLAGKLQMWRQMLSAVSPLYRAFRA